MSLILAVPLRKKINVSVNSHVACSEYSHACAGTNMPSVFIWKLTGTALYWMSQHVREN